jgi:transposase
MNQTLFIPNKLSFTLLNLDHNSTFVDFHVISNQISSHCLLYQFTTTKIHSNYIRMIGDLPVSGKIVQLKLHVRKFICENINCIRKIFTERFKHQLISYGRRFERLNEQLSSMGLELGGALLQRFFIYQPSHFARVLSYTIRHEHSYIPVYI